MVTAYDFSTAQVAERAGVDLVLVGDSAAMVVLGYDSTRLVTIDEMLMLTRAVRRGAPASLVIGDLPYMSYESSNGLAVASATRFKEAGCDAVKMEGAGPEGFRVHGKTADAALEIIASARALDAAGCFAI